MAENQVNINLSLLDQQSTIKKRTAEVENLNNQLDRTQKLASGGIPATGTKTGAQALRATEAPDSTVRLQRTTITTGLQDSTRDQTNPQARRAGYGMMTDYTTAGGVSGRGGASARDFAAEAQGLGGLVRLYATYAANVFAVTAAFTALREAMNTDIMIKGMEQLGAATGQSLVGMTKSFVSVTDGMVSFREAAEAVTKASSSGLGREQILGIAEVAKGASQALGVNMSDAVSRLSRGIVKLEPELLDELGLFTKTGKAAEDYARKVGKTESQLTDFERRQAFANAVLEEGRKKFGEIAQEGNPYDKLLASLKNTAQDILSVVNTVVAPVAKILADNTGLIGAAIALAAIKITQQAIPALNRYSDYLKTTAAEAGKMASIQSERAWATQVDTAKERLGISASEKRVVGLKAEQVILNDQLTTLEKQKASIAEIIALENRMAVIQAKIGGEKRLQAELDRKLQDQMEKSPSIFRGDTHAMMMASASKAANRAYAVKDIQAQVVEKTADAGTIAGFSELVRLTGEYGTKLGGIGKITTVVSGTLSILGQTFLNVTRFISGLLGYIGLAITVFEVLDSMFSTNSKSASKLSDSLAQLEETTKTAIDTNKKWEGSIGLEAAIAYANSLDALSSSVRNATKAFNDFKTDSSGWDKAIEWLKDVTPFVDSMQEKLASQLGKSVMASIEALPVGPAREQFRKQYAEILNIPIGKLSAKSITKAVEGGDVDQLNQLDSALEQTNKRIQESSTYLKGLKESGDLAEKSMATFMNSMRDSSPLTTFFVNAIKYSGELNKALADTSFTTIAAGLDKLSTTDLSMFGSAALDIQAVVTQFNSLKPAYESAAKTLESYKDKLDELQQRRASKNLTNAGRRELDAQIAEQRSIISAQESSVENIRKEIESLGREAETFIKRSIGDQVTAALEQFRLKLAQVQLQSQKDIVSKGFGDTISGTQAVAEISKQQVSVELQLITSQDRLADKIELLRLEIADAKDREALRAATSAEGIVSDQGQKIQASMSARELQRQFLEVGGKFSSQKAQKDFDAQFAELQKTIPENSALLSILERRQRTALGVANAAAKNLAIDFDAAMKKLDIEAKRQTDGLKFEFDKLNNVINAIGSDTPERLGAQLSLAQTVLQEQYKLIDQAADAALKRAQTAREMALRAGQKPSDVAKQFEEKTGQIELERSRSKELLNQKTLLEQIGKQEQYNLQVVERNFDLYMRLADAYKSLITGTGVASQEARFAAEQQARQARDTLQSFREESTLRREQRTLDRFSADLTQKYGSEEAAQREMTPSERLTMQGLQETVTETKQWNQQSKQVRVEISGIADKVGLYAVETAKINAANANTLAILDEIKNAEDQIFQRKNHELDIEKQRFDVLSNLGIYTQDEKNRLSANLQIKQIELKVEQDLAVITAERTRLEINLANARRQAGGMEGLDPNTDPQVIAANQALASLNARQQLTIQQAQNARELVERSVMIPDRFTNFANKFEELFNGMADAVVQWAATGKSSFKDVINSFLMDIARYEMRLQMHALYVQALRPLLGSLFGNLFGSGNVSYVEGGFGTPGGFAFAKGGAFDVGLQTYAKGGMFTNQIVNQPTLFKAAKGLGVMGEAGPEAIMPLTRDSDGVLGVRSSGNSGGGNVEVVVNNYTAERAETKETVDSRGNRRIEVVVGEMVATQMTTPNSSVQQAMLSGFGARPRMVRR